MSIFFSDPIILAPYIPGFANKKDLFCSDGLTLPSQARVLELGCGTGASCVWLATLPEVEEVVGVDIVPAAIARCEERAREVFGDQAQKIIGDSGSAQLIQNVEVTEHSVPVLQAPWLQFHKHDQSGRSGDVQLNCVHSTEIPSSNVLLSKDSAPSKSIPTSAALCTAVPLLSSDRHAKCTFLVMDALNLHPSFRGAFDFIYDCQTFHALYFNYPRIAVVLTQCLSSRGHLFILTGNDREPAVGPTVMSQSQILAAFPNLHCVFIKETRFDSTPQYKQLSLNPLAWCVLFCKNIKNCSIHRHCQ